MIFGVERTRGYSNDDTAGGVNYRVRFILGSRRRFVDQRDERRLTDCEISFRFVHSESVFFAARSVKQARHRGKEDGIRVLWTLALESSVDVVPLFIAPYDKRPVHADPVDLGQTALCCVGRIERRKKRLKIRRQFVYPLL
jgi:hypothetical protein